MPQTFHYISNSGRLTQHLYGVPPTNLQLSPESLYSQDGVTKRRYEEISLNNNFLKTGHRVLSFFIYANYDYDSNGILPLCDYTYLCLS
jgi:hypothetical protein